MKHKVPMRKTAFQAETIRIGSRQIDAIKLTCMNGQAESSRVSVCVCEGVCVSVSF